MSCVKFGGGKMDVVKWNSEKIFTFVEVTQDLFFSCIIELMNSLKEVP